MTDNGYSTATRSMLGLYVLQAGIALVLFGLYKSNAVGLAMLTTKYGVVVLAGTCICALGAGAALIAWRENKRAATMGLVGNIASVAIVFAVLESVLNLLERRSIEGDSVLGVALRPTWTGLQQQIRDTPPRDQTFFTYDAELGWTVGANRQSADKIYFSSDEGIRSEKPGVRYADDLRVRRVALIGDSNAFSLEVPFDDSWGERLNRLLGDEVRVLNFGVDGYGIDQIYLRYLRDVRPWKPAVVVVGFIQHDLIRSMAVYPFISFGWPRYLTKPRFDLVGDRLIVVNRPLRSPEEIGSATHPDELPYIDYDPGWTEQDWSWRFDNGPLLLRLLTSVSPRWPDRHALGTADAETLNDRLLNALVAAIEEDGAKAVVVYLPHWTGSNELAYSTLQKSGLPYLDMTACLRGIPREERQVASGAHYTGVGNQAIAGCTAPTIRCGLGTPCDRRGG
jgi:hypothetical protein